MTSTQHDATWPLVRPAAPLDRSKLAARIRQRAPLASLLGLTALLYLFGLSRIGYGNDFYAAAVKAGTESWKSFFFGSFDSANYITVDKPPASFWLMELSGRIFGFSSFSMLLPQALEGVAAVALLYATVRRWFSTPAALLSGAVLALTPVAALMFRYNNPDALLLLLLVLGAYAVTRALERGSTRWLVLAGVAIGFGFLTKMMEAFLVVPAFALVYLLAAPTSLPRRIGQLLLSGIAMIAACGWWVAIVELVPAADRPYVGGSSDNSILNLIWGYNGLGRIEGNTGGAGGAGFSGSPGALRLFGSAMGGQIGWLLPAALIVLAAGLALRLRAPRTDRTRAALLLWGGWLIVTAAVFSLMSGVIHPYYTNILAAPIAALVGVGGVELWRRRGSLAVRALLSVILVATGALSYALLDRTPDWYPALRDAVLAAAVVSALVVWVVPRLPWPARGALVSVALLATLGGPIAYTLETISSPQSGSIVSAGPVASRSNGAFARAGRAGAIPGASSSAAGPGAALKGIPAAARGSASTRPALRAGAHGRPAGSTVLPTGARGFSAAGGAGTSVSSALKTLLAADSSSYVWVAATSSSQDAAPIELATGRAVMAIGGFTGSDPAITLARFKALVSAGKIHYYIGGGGGGGGAGGIGGQAARSSVASQIESWVTSTFKATSVGGTTIYDLSS